MRQAITERSLSSEFAGGSRYTARASRSARPANSPFCFEFTPALAQILVGAAVQGIHDFTGA